jgi:PhnB protein
MFGKKVRPIPEGYHTVTPHLVLDDCARAIEFYKQALGAVETMRMRGPDGKIIHAEIRIGDSIVMLTDEMPQMSGMPGVFKSPKSTGLSTVGLFLYVHDTDASFDRAVRAGCSVRMRPADMFWGDRYSQVIDPFGHAWAFATHREDVSRSDMEKRQVEFFAKMTANMQQPHKGPAKQAA